MDNQDNNRLRAEIFRAFKILWLAIEYDGKADRIAKGVPTIKEAQAAVDDTLNKIKKYWRLTEGL